MRHKGDIFVGLLQLTAKCGIKVLFSPDFQAGSGRIRGKRIGISSVQDIDGLNYVLSHELAHYYLHADKGDIRTSPDVQQYEEQADRAANLLLDALAIEQGNYSTEQKNNS